MINSKFPILVATALALPIVTYADIKIYGQIGAEAASVEYAGGEAGVNRGVISNSLSFTKDSDNMDRQTLTRDRYGSILNDGPNLIGLDFTGKDKIQGLTPVARYRTTFHTTNNSGFNPGLEAWVGLKNSFFQMKYGKLRGAYRNAKGLIDPWIYTSMQARGTGGGLSSGRYNEVHWNWNETGRRDVVAQDDGTVGIEHGRAIDTSGLIHNSDIPGALELGIKQGPFGARLQIMGDDAADKNGGNLELKFTLPNLVVWSHAAYFDQGENANDLIGGAQWNNETFFNWKAGVQYRVITSLKLAIQYEKAELGTFDNNPNGGQYLITSFDYTANSITFAGWISKYFSDIEEQHKLMDIDGQILDEDVVSWTLGVKYHFNKDAHVFIGYRDTNSDNDYRDENVVSAGMLYKF